MIAGTTILDEEETNLPWYKHGWLWFLLAIPGVAVIGGFGLLYLAISTWDGLVADDYYKEGNAIAQTIERSLEAGRRELAADMALENDAIIIRLASTANAELPGSLHVTISHPTRVGLDQHLELIGHNGVYTGAITPLVAAHWNIILEDEAREWRLNGSANLPAVTELKIVPYKS